MKIEIETSKNSLVLTDLHIAYSNFAWFAQFCLICCFQDGMNSPTLSLPPSFSEFDLKMAARLERIYFFLILLRISGRLYPTITIEGAQPLFMTKQTFHAGELYLKCNTYSFSIVIFLITWPCSRILAPSFSLACFCSCTHVFTLLTTISLSWCSFSPLVLASFSEALNLSLSFAASWYFCCKSATARCNWSFWKRFTQKQ